MSRPIVLLSALLISLTSCDTQSGLLPAPTTAPIATTTISTTFPTPATSSVSTPTRASTNAPTLGPTPRFRTPTPPANPGTVITEEGSFLVLSHPTFFWTLKLPRDWFITYDRGFELFANNPQQTAFMRVFSQVWPTQQEWLPNARAYVDYWKQYPGGNRFPIYAAGTQLAESEISPDKYGGPYLRYEFDDAKGGLRYLQVYASGGGPNSVVLTVWTKPADRDVTQASLESILSSLALLKLP